MKAKFTITLSLAALLLAACNTKNNTNAESAEQTAETAATDSMSVIYTVAENYFHKNDAPLPDSMKITSAEEFERHFGMAAHMGDNGQPTEIDFAKSFVIAKVLPSTDRQTELTPLNLRQEQGRLMLTYHLKQGDNQSYTTQPMFILVVPAEYRDLPIEEVME